jgi:hypothetical protein
MTDPQGPTPLEVAIGQARAIDNASNSRQAGAGEALQDINSLLVVEKKLASFQQLASSMGAGSDDSTTKAIVAKKLQNAIGNTMEYSIETLEREKNNLAHRHANTLDPLVNGQMDKVKDQTWQALDAAENSLKAMSGKPFDPAALNGALANVDNAAQTYKAVAAMDLVMASEDAVRRVNDPATRDAAAHGNASAKAALDAATTTLTVANDFVGGGRAGVKLEADLRKDESDFNLLYADAAKNIGNHNRQLQLPMPSDADLKDNINRAKGQFLGPARDALGSDFYNAISDAVADTKNGSIVIQDVKQSPTSSGCGITAICGTGAKTR